MSNLLNIRNQIQTLLQDLLGSYVDSEGERRPAIWVGGTSPAAIDAIQGLEIVIEATPDISITRLSARDRLIKEVYKIRLIQHTPNYPLTEPLRVLAVYMNLDTDPRIIPEGDNTFEQAVVYVRVDYAAAAGT